MKLMSKSYVWDKDELNKKSNIYRPYTNQSAYTLPLGTRIENVTVDFSNITADMLWNDHYDMWFYIYRGTQSSIIKDILFATASTGNGFTCYCNGTKYTEPGTITGGTPVFTWNSSASTIVFEPEYAETKRYTFTGFTTNPSNHTVTEIGNTPISVGAVLITSPAIDCEYLYNMIIGGSSE